MTLIWVLLGIVVLGGVAVVAAGRGQGLTPPEPDRPDLVLPPDRPLAKPDVDAVRFSVGLRGYRMDEVDDVLDRLAADIAARDARIAVLEQEAAARRPEQEAAGSGEAAPTGGPLDGHLDRHSGGRPDGHVDGLPDEDELTVARTLIVPVHELGEEDVAPRPDGPDEGPDAEL